jgi:hypothetical protein
MVSNAFLSRSKNVPLTPALSPSEGEREAPAHSRRRLHRPVAHSKHRGSGGLNKLPPKEAVWVVPFFGLIEVETNLPATRQFKS